MRLIAAIEDPRTAARILAHLGLPTRAPPRGPPWHPDAIAGLPPQPERPHPDYDGIDPPAPD